MKISPIWSNVLKIVFFIVKCNESEHKINSFIFYLAKIIFKISWVTFL